ncbi:MAG TPA: rhomboid family intramembrane serine protease [Acidimicrobiales bacterium]|nr:rhomboid family intramembrane serine protease [Acidimicrobiales bacterium]
MAERPTTDSWLQRIGAPARNAAIAMAVFLVVIWVLQIADSLMHYSLLRFGIQPRWPSRLGDIFSAPFLHVSYAHISDNTLPLAVLGFLVALRGIARFLAVTLVIIVIGGLGVWLTASSGTDTVGASGVIFGYLGFLVARGAIERRLLDIVVAVLVGALYWSILPLLLPGNPGISWQGHLFGLAGGVTSAWWFRSRRPELPPADQPAALPAAA